ncbi:ARM repeat-containing protein [Hypoxylon sp. NC1633]|nr:ARM repeat-containing protein [Hypoxylon sp. NC1633]
MLMALASQSVVAVLAKLDGTAPEQITALRYIKNEVIGHIHKKEDWLQLGAIPPIVRIISSDTFETKDKDTRPPSLTLPAFTDDDNAKLQALQLLASFANGGPAFLPPIYVARAIPVVLSSSCLENEHPQIVLAALRVMRDIAEAATYAPPSSPITLTTLAEFLFDEGTLVHLNRIISQRSPTPDGEAQISIVTHLIKDLCREERHRSALATSGILDPLSTKLASFAVLQGQVLPRAELIDRLYGLEDYIPEPATKGMSFDGILGAIASIIRGSISRACKLLYSPSILAVFPITNMFPGRSWTSLTMELPGLRPKKYMQFEPMNVLLPRQPQVSNHGTCPPPGTSRDLSRNGRSASTFHSNADSQTPSEETYARNTESEGEEAESPLIPWLLVLIRSRRGSEMLMAVSILAALFRSGYSHKTRDADLGLLVVPVLLRMLSEVEAKMKDVDYNNYNRETAELLYIIEEAPAVLTHLVTDNELLQKAAFENNAVKTLCKLFKDTYGPPPPLAKTWSSSLSKKGLKPVVDLPPERRLGEEGQPRYLVHRLRVRESCLRAIACVASLQDGHRKAVVEQDVVPYVVESLTPSSSNPPSVVLAALYVQRMLSRSVRILRTVLVDHGVSHPIFMLLRHHDVEIQVAAASAICNLVMDFSPLRETLVDLGVTKLLCEHAHSHKAQLRLNALWALKHLVHSSSVSLKKKCVEDLESGWLVHLICDDTEDDAVFSAKTKGENEDIDMGISESTAPRGPLDARIQRDIETRLEAVREAEANWHRKVRHLDLGIQEQGLGFIRNLIGGAHSSGSADSPNDTTEMIDFLFSTLGQDRLFEILASKLRVKVLHPFSRRGVPGTETRILPPQTKIIESVIYILVHIAASIPRHRQLVVSQTELLKQLAKLFTSQDREVRVALCHLINNLTWQDNVNDGPGCSQRALELKKLGFLSKLEALKEGDDELDVRERAKSALWQMKPAY